MVVLVLHIYVASSRLNYKNMYKEKKQNYSGLFCWVKKSYQREKSLLLCSLQLRNKTGFILKVVLKYFYVFFTETINSILWKKKSLLMWKISSMHRSRESSMMSPHVHITQLHLVLPFLGGGYGLRGWCILNQIQTLSFHHVCL